MNNMLTAILHGIAYVIYNKVFFGNKNNTIDKRTKSIMKNFKHEGDVLSIYLVAEDIYMVYTDKNGYLFNFITKNKCICNPNEQTINNNCKLIYSVN